MIWQRGTGAQVVELTFVLPSDHPATPVGVAGEFNGWHWEATQFQRRGGFLVACAVVAAGRSYRFRYRSAGGTWFNDDHADDYVDNPYGGVDCVFDTSIERRGLTPMEVLNSPNHRAMLERISTISSDQGGTPVTEDQIFTGMKYTLGSRPIVVTSESGPNPLSHLLTDLAQAELIQRQPASGPDGVAMWMITSTGSLHLRDTAWPE
jgi:hypothetical protein